MASNKIIAVLFDWDDTLVWIVQKGQLPIRITCQMKKAGLDYAPQDMAAAIAERREQIRRLRWPGPITLRKRQDILCYYQQLLVLLGSAIRSRALAIRIYNALGELPVNLFPDTCETIERLKAAGIRMGVISNTGRATRPIMESTLGGWIEPRYLLLSEEEHVHIPFPKFFRRAASRLAVPPERCLFVGDNLLVDAIGAVESGYATGLWLDRDLEWKGERLSVPSIDSLVHIFRYLS